MKKLMVFFLALMVQSQIYAQIPASPKKPIKDTYFGMQVTDNYRWLEDTKDTVVKTWFKAQADYTNTLLDKIPGRDSLIKTFETSNLLKPYNINFVGKKGGRYFYKKTLPAENVGKLYYRVGENGKEILLYDPLPVGGKPILLIISYPVKMAKRSLSASLSAVRKLRRSTS
ncbi:hypothetical protein [Mucilaginibacter glaciei]|uniref:Peptidase S9A N-terminal domain-containing protein n=1 Tax=Mucilaginibacter glaciei TaxID=2772109 RepID=A0A926NLH7_9SPHI|nr:hypothetical protein [Mucilaginibacter glaciei]MBD1393411.1 hypothetical protein [Mucilaginibacter glaciei]